MNTPQDLLDQIHASMLLSFNVTDSPTKTARLEQIKLARQKLRFIKKQLQDSQNSIKAKWDGRKQGEQVQEHKELKPFTIIENIILEIEIKLSEMELDPNTQMATYGKVIFGDLDFGFWAIGSEIEAKTWYKEYEKQLILQLAKANKEELIILTEDTDLLIKQIRDNIRSMERQLNSKVSMFKVISFLLILLFLGVVLADLLGRLNLKTNEIFMIIGVFSLLLAMGIIVIYRWFSYREQLRNSITQSDIEIQELQDEKLSLKNDYVKQATELKSLHDKVVVEIKNLRQQAFNQSPE